MYWFFVDKCTLLLCKYCARVTDKNKILFSNTPGIALCYLFFRDANYRKIILFILLPELAFNSYM